MCPEEERTRRLEEYGALHELERCDESVPELSTPQLTMVNELNVPKLVRTPRALLKTIIYMEENIMELIDDYDLSKEEEDQAVPSPVVVSGAHTPLAVISNSLSSIRSIYSFGIVSV